MLRRTLCFEIRELNLQALPQRWETGATASNVFPSRSDLAAPMSSRSCAKLEFMGPQNCCNGKHPDTMIKVFRALLYNTQDTTERMAIYSSTQQCIQHPNHDKTYISHEQLHIMELCIYHSIMAQVEGLQGEFISHMCRWTGT
jgi:hypothetical protein